MEADAYGVKLPAFGSETLMEADAYVVKLQTYGNEPLFGDLVEGSVILNSMGQIVADEWISASQNYRDIRLDRWIVMPSYIRGIVLLPAQAGELAGHTLPAPSVSGKPRLLSSFVAGFKAAAAKRVNLYRNQPALPLWQRNYSQTLIPDEVALGRIRRWLQESSEQP
ncbi:hypothetical protein [Pseudanabaena sp. FACHB-2040]|uniref:hypothetical protein n=1 Tax=Pseudanabaena sp. FACHB-2040 TaxID=2692859 RepID=UPI001685919A|nr:hypothetical protein [Pseudanabaena sp. FACHB-2040]MBD2256788.1 hypothetical protein [Pseudanabaena sp. FACHB-2040]